MEGDLAPGSVVGQYVVDSFVGRGGMGVVYLAEHRTLQRRVALKVVSPELVSDEAFRDRFLREARLAASLEHPNIIPVFDAGIDGDVLYIAMRYVRGENLGTVLEREGRLTVERALSILAKVASALDDAHGNDLVHRDVKPDNVLLGRRETGEEVVYLTDFGLVRRIDSRTKLTKTGYMMGTLNYMAPEIFRGHDVDGRTDVYSLACVLFECLTGGPPYPRDLDAAVIGAHLMDPPPSVTAIRPDLPPAIDGVIAKGMAKERDDRYRTCGDLISSAERALLEPVETARPPERAWPAGAEPLPPPPLDSTPGAIETQPAAPPAEAEPTPALPARGDSGRPRVPRSRLALPLVASLALVAVAILVVRPLIEDDEPTTNGTGATGATSPTGTTGAGEEPGTGIPVVATVPGRPASIRLDDSGTPWVTTDDGGGAVFRIDPEDGTTERIPVGSNPGRLTFTGEPEEGDLWVVNEGDGTVTRIPLPFPRARVETIEVGREPSRIIAPGGTGAVWVVSADGILTRIDLSTSVPTGIMVENGSAALCFSAGAFWVANAASGTVSRVDPVELDVEATIPVGDGPTSVQPGFDRVWVANTDAGTVSAIDPESDSVVGVIEVGTEPTGVTNDEISAMWVRNQGETTLSKIDPVALIELSRVEVGGRPIGFAKAGGLLWVITEDGGLWRVDPATAAADRFELDRTPVALAGLEDEVWVVATDGSILRIEATA